MPRVDERVALAFSVALIVAVASLGSWCYLLYRANVQQTALISILQRSIENDVEPRIDDHEASIEQLATALAQVTDGGSNKLDRIGNQVASLEQTITDIQGPTWLAPVGRDLGELDADLERLDNDLQGLNSDVMRVDQCVDSIARAADGSSSYIFC